MRENSRETRAPKGQRLIRARDDLMLTVLTARLSMELAEHLGLESSLHFRAVQSALAGVTREGSSPASSSPPGGER